MLNRCMTTETRWKVKMNFNDIVIIIILFMELMQHNQSTCTRNTLDCDQSNYSSRIVFSHIPIEFGQTGISAIRSADTEIRRVDITIWIFQDGGWAAILDSAKPEIAPFDPPTSKTPPQNQTWSGSDDPSRRYDHLKFSKCEVVGRSSIYTSSYTDLIYS